MRRCAIGILFVFVISGLGLAQCAPKIQPFVSDSGYTVKTTSACGVWILTDALPNIPRNKLQGAILIAEDGDIVIIGAVVQLKADVDLSAASLLKLVRLNHNIDYAKVGIDNDGDLFVRTELRTATIDAGSFNHALKSVIAASNKVYDAVKK